MSTESVCMRVAVALLGVLGCGLYAGLETGLYSLNRVRLHLLTHQHHPGAILLTRLLTHPASLLAGLLIGTNMATYLATASIGNLLAELGYSSRQIIVYDVLIVTPLLFVFAETLPKDLFNVFADRLVYRFARLLTLTRWVLTWVGLLPLVTGLSWLTMRLLGGRQPVNVLEHPRRRIGMLMREGVGHGLLSEEQSAITQRVLSLYQRQVENEMTPWNKVQTFQLTDDAKTIWQRAARSSLSRYPVLDENQQVVGMFSLYEALPLGRQGCRSVAQLTRPVLRIEAGTGSWEALGMLKKQQVSLAVVQRKGQPIGIVTIKDLVEPIVGELESW